MSNLVSSTPEDLMRRAIALARQGEGFVEPNPMVGAVIVTDAGRIVGEGYHARFGGPHAEVGALAQAGEQARGATLYVTLEPCCHWGKTPPCSEAVIRAGLKKVVVALADPFPRVAGQGIEQLRQAGMAVDVGLLADEARQLAAPFLKLVETGRPYLHAKWAMTLDGKIASRTGASQWISNEQSRRIVHQLRGRMDAIVVGIGTALADDPALTARPPGPRVATRVVLDRQARLPVSSQLVQTAREVPVLVMTSSRAPSARVDLLRQAGVEVCELPDEEPAGEPVASPLAHAQAVSPRNVEFLKNVCRELGRRRMTNVLVEGGSAVLGACRDAGLIDFVHVFIAPKILGGAAALTPLTGWGDDRPANQPQLQPCTMQNLDGDVYISGPVVQRTMTLS